MSAAPSRGLIRRRCGAGVLFCMQFVNRFDGKERIGCARGAHQVHRAFDQLRMLSGDVDQFVSGPFVKLVPLTKRPYGRLYAY